MNARRRRFGVVAAFLGFALTLALAPYAWAGEAAAERQRVNAPLAGFDVGVDDSELSDAATAQTALVRAADLHAEYVRIVVNWSSVAPDAPTRPVGFDPRNPADPRYNWVAIDGQVRRAVAAGFTPYVLLLNAPRWAQNGRAPDDALAGNGAWRPSAREFGNFAHAAAVRYSGGFDDAVGPGALPRVAIWQAWNEPNLPLFLAPSSPDLYRSLLNSMYDEVKAVQPTSTIVTAGLAPVKSSSPAVFPKEFALRLLCLAPAGGWYERDASCPEAAKFDVFSVHPYSLRAKPTQRARISGNMFVADVADIGQMLKAAQSRDSVSRGAKRLWITEFAWFTNAPNKSVGDRPALAAMRTSIALYLFWRAGVSQLTWYALSDDSAAIVKGGGLFDSSGNPKPTYYALRFPFFVRLEGRRLLIWGKAPRGDARRVSVTVRRGGRYKFVASIRPAGNGVFRKTMTVKRGRSGRYRAVQGAERSLPLGSRDYFK